MNAKLTPAKRVKFQILIAAIIIISGCNKLPVADFTTDKGEYTAGEKVKLTNKSENAETYIWTMPDGTTRKDENVTFSTSSSLVGTRLFKLEAISKKGTKSNYIVKSIFIKTPSGKLVLYDGSSYKGAVNIFVDDVFHSQVTFPTGASIPTCDQAGYPTITLTEGPHVIRVSGPTTWTKTIIIIGNQCVVSSYR